MLRRSRLWIISAAVAAVGLAGADPFNVYKGHSCRTFYAEIPDWAGVAALGNAGVIGSYIDKADSRLECRIYITMPTLP